jgi:hypothetical protein
MMNLAGLFPRNMRASRLLHFFVCAEAEYAGALFALHLRNGQASGARTLALKWRHVPLQRQTIIDCTGAREAATIQTAGAPLRDLDAPAKETDMTDPQSFQATQAQGGAR